MFGELQPIGGGDPIPLLKKTLRIGRRENCDIVLRFSNVSAHHCELTVKEGYWFVTDSNSRNGTKVNGKRVTEMRIDPGDILSVAKHRYEMHYNPSELGAIGPPPRDERAGDILGTSLLERAGLKKREGDEEDDRYDILEDKGGRFRDPDKPV